MPSRLQGMRQRGQENHAAFENPSSKEPGGRDLGEEPQQPVTRSGSRRAFTKKGAMAPAALCHSTTLYVQIPEEMHMAAHVDAGTPLTEAMLPLHFPQEQLGAP